MRAQCEASLVTPEQRGNFLPLLFSPAPEPLWALTALGKCHMKIDGVKEVLVLYLPGGGEGGVGLPIVLHLLPGQCLDSFWCPPHDLWLWSEDPSVVASGAGFPPGPRKV